MVTAIECEEHDGNGGGCLPLRIVHHDMNALKQRQDAVDQRVGEIIGIVSESRSAANRAEAAAQQSVESSLRIERKLFDPANKAIARYHDSNPPLLDDMGEITKTQDLPTLYKRAKQAERQATRQRLIGAVTSVVLVIGAILTGIARAKGWIPAILLGIALAGGPVACSPSTQDRAMQSAVVASNETAAIISGLQTSALALYQLEQELSVAAAYNRGDSKAEAIARVYSIRKTWEPVWQAFEALRLSHQTMATLISTAGTTAAQFESARAAVALKLSQVQALVGAARTRIGG